MSNEWLMKICSVGSYRVGKTSLIRRYAEGKFSSDYLPTIGVDVTVKRLTLELKNRPQRVRLLLMDTAGQEQFGKLRHVYYEGSSACIAVYDVTREDTFESLPRWIEDFRKVAGQKAHIAIIGNKIDLEELRSVTTKQGEEYAKKHNFPFYECSAKLGSELIPEIYLELIHRQFNSLGN